MINVEKIVFETQNYYTPSWSGVTTVKILEVLPKGKVRVKAGEAIFVRSIQYIFNTAKAASTSRREWESFERKRKKSVKKRKKKYKMTKNKARKRPVVCRSKMLEYKNDKRL